MGEWLVVGEALTALLVLGVLASHGLAREDPWFTGYLAWFCLTTASLWVVWQARPGWYAAAFFGMNAVGLVLAGRIVSQAQTSWAGTQLVALVGIFLALLLWESQTGMSAPPRTELLMGLAGALLLAFGLAALVGSWRALGASGFEHIKLQGLALFWLTQAAPCWAYLLRSERWQAASAMAAALGLLAFAWMALSFAGPGLEGARELGEKQVPHPASCEQQAAFPSAVLRASGMTELRAPSLEKRNSKLGGAR